MTGKEKLTPARERALQEIAESDRRTGCRPIGENLRAARGFEAWGWVEYRMVRGFLQQRYFITPAGKDVLERSRAPTSLGEG